MQTSEHNSELGRWRNAQRAAHPALRGYVHAFFASSSALPQRVLERQLPSTEVVLLLNFGAPHRREERGRWVDRDDAWLIGLHDGPQRSEALGERHFLAVSFTPLGAHLFLGMPMHETASRTLALSDVDARLAREVMSKVGIAKGWEDRFNAMEAVIANRVEQRVIPSPIAWAWERIARADGRIAVGRLASELAYSHHRLTREFEASIGQPPKMVAQVFRFNRALRMLNRRLNNRPPKASGKPYLETSGLSDAPAVKIAWAELASACGYFDQPHLIREFRRFAGLTPTAFLRSMSDVD